MGDTARDKSIGLFVELDELHLSDAVLFQFLTDNLTVLHTIQLTGSQTIVVLNFLCTLVGKQFDTTVIITTELNLHGNGNRLTVLGLDAGFDDG